MDRLDVEGIAAEQASRQRFVDMRLDRARALLVQDELTVGEVVREVGYTSASYFINEFKRQFGTTPGAYARAQREAVAMRVEEATYRAA